MTEAPPIIDVLIADLDAESQALDDLVADLSEEQWRIPTPASGWDVAHQIGHLLWTDRTSLVAATDPDGFAEQVAQAVASGKVETYVDDAAAAEARLPPAELLSQWRSNRAKLAGALLAVPAGQKLPWFGPSMSAPSMATARMMETWAHGLDVADALGVERTDDDRIKNVVHLGVRTRNFAYTVNGLPIPAAQFRYEIVAPSGELWTWGPQDAADVVRGPAVDFCSLITQRRNRADLDLEIIGDDAEQWASIAQCFAGPPGEGRAPAHRAQQAGGNS